MLSLTDFLIPESSLAVLSICKNVLVAKHFNKPRGLYSQCSSVHGANRNAHYLILDAVLLYYSPHMIELIYCFLNDCQALTVLVILGRMCA